MRKFLFLFLILAIFIGCAAPQSRDDSAASSKTESNKETTFQGPFSLWGDDWAFRFSSVNKWEMQWEDAYKYEANAYFTLNGTQFTQSNTIIAFYIFKHSELDLSKVVAEDIEKFKTDYPGIRIENFQFKNMDYNYYINTKKYPVINNGKVFQTIMYDFTSSSVEHFDRFEFVVFFKLNPDDEDVCVLQLSSQDEEAFKYIDDLKFIFMTFEKGEIPENENFY